MDALHKKIKRRPWWSNHLTTGALVTAISGAFVSFQSLGSKIEAQDQNLAAKIEAQNPRFEALQVTVTRIDARLESAEKAAAVAQEGVERVGKAQEAEGKESARTSAQIEDHERRIQALETALAGGKR